MLYGLSGFDYGRQFSLLYLKNIIMVKSFVWRSLPPLLLLLILLWLGLFILSPLNLSGRDAWLVLIGQNGQSVAFQVMYGIRLPRMLGAVVLGAALAVAGGVMQAVTRNPLASPNILGVNAGAAVALVLVSGFSPSWVNGVSLATAAAVGGGLAWALVMMIGWQRGGWSQQRLVLAGVTVSAFCAALTKAALILFEDNAYSVMSWLAGSVGNVRWAQLKMLFWGCLPAFLLVGYLLPRLNLLALGDDVAQSLGVRLNALRAMLCGAVLVLTGVCVSVVGPVAFLSLLVPHIARLWFGVDMRVLLPGAAILGGLLMLMADLLARWLVFPQEMPAGAVVAVIGAPCFVWFAMRKRVK